MTAPAGDPARPVRVLLVDDHEAMLTRAASVLKASCVIVGTARNGGAAIQAALALRPDVIVLDMSMPDMTGLEVAAALRDTGSTAAILFLTMHEGDEFLSVARQAGAIGYVFKPRLIADLAEAVQKASGGDSFTSPAS
jgi:DNA-binding NarL/FixJ family response regulator